MSFLYSALVVFGYNYMNSNILYAVGMSGNEKTLLKSAMQGVYSWKQIGSDQHGYQ